MNNLGGFAMETVETKVSEAQCTGCGGCMNVCPVDAITMVENKEGFIVPAVNKECCVECGKCVSLCPALNVKYINKSEPDVYAVRACDEIRKNSSSGGMFTLLAESIFKNGGIVYGAAFDENMQLRHASAQTMPELAPLRGSKYVQSNVGAVYREIKDKLESGRQALFTGTPCQVAALNSFLNRRYDNLFTVDLLCHGVPSQYELNKYIDELHQKLNIPNDVRVKDIRFRDKKFGWSSEHIVVEFENGALYEADVSKDVYEKMFYRNLGLRKSCSDCPFSAYPRQGDISIGDFWGISRIDKSLNDGKGTSLVIVNSEKGLRLFAAAVGSNVMCDMIKFDPDKIRNRTHTKYPANVNRDRFLNLLRKRSYSDAIAKAVRGKFDVGIVSNWYAGNFGGSLTQYALYHTIEDMGYSALMIERPADAPDKASIKTINKIYKEMPYPTYAIAKQYDDKRHMSELNKICDKFVVGSDQLFQYALYCQLGKYVTLDWVDDSKLKIAYAASYGHDHIWGAEDDLSEMAYFMQKFDYFSTREKGGVEISKNKFGVNAEFVLDPVFLCDQKHYGALINKSDRVLEKKYISSYLLDPDENKYEIICEAKSYLNMPEEIYSELSYSPEYIAPLKELNVIQLKVEERLHAIKNCDFFITDSFHGTCFAILFKRPFISILNSRRGGSRFKSLLEMFHLEDRLIENVSDIKNRRELFDEIDYDAVYKILGSERERSINWLRNALKDNKLKPKTAYQVLSNVIEAQRAEIIRLKKGCSDLSNMISTMHELMGLGFVHITEFTEYLDCLNKVKGKYVICISVKDTPGVIFKPEFDPFLKNLGVSTSLVKKHWRPYIAVIDTGGTIYEKLGDISEQMICEVRVDGIRIRITSAGFKSANRSEIIVNDVDFSKNRRGLNFAVIDKNTGTVVDSVCFDTNVGALTCTR
ncbi:MAG: polysaccharide pyruvyl transferase family protein [Acetatifactor sp.]|nr:polysaccharide pyruvyl transferase family protein [Acetatifactor sp.]